MTALVPCPWAPASPSPLGRASRGGAAWPWGRVAPGGWSGSALVIVRAGPLGVRRAGRPPAAPPGRTERRVDPCVRGAGAGPRRASACRAGARSGRSTTRPTSTCRGVFVGRNEVVGQAVPLYQPIVTPFTQTPAVWFSWELERYRSPGDDSEWVTVEKRSTAAPFWIQDDTGRVLIRPRGAELEPVAGLCENARPRLRPALQPLAAPPVGAGRRGRAASAAQTMADTSFAPGPHGRRRLVRQHARHRPARSPRCRASTASPSRCIAAGAPIYLLGTARPRTDGTGLEFTGERGPAGVHQVRGAGGVVERLVGPALRPRLPALLGGLRRRRHRRAVRRDQVVPHRLALGIEVGGPLPHRPDAELQPPGRGEGAGGQGLVAHRRQPPAPVRAAAATWSRWSRGTASTSARCRRRVAELRAVPAPPPTEELPTRRHPRRRRDHRPGPAGGRPRPRWRWPRRYPDLKASQVYLDLQARIADAEESVASARAVLQRRHRGAPHPPRRSSPAACSPGSSRCPSWKLFEAEEAARVRAVDRPRPGSRAGLDPVARAVPPAPPAPSAGTPPAAPPTPPARARGTAF